MHRQLLILLSFVPFIHSCFTINRCPCDRVQYIDQAGIQQLEYGSYLANRTTTRPNVTVTDSCQILVDVSKLETDNHYLMVFRDGAPPIFVKRFSGISDKSVELSDISCVKVGEEFEWQYYNGKVIDLSIAVQSNEEMCGCNSPEVQEWSVNMTVDPERCDSFSTRCLKEGYGLYMAEEDSVFFLAYSQNATAVIDDLTCVSGQWYHNNVESNTVSYCAKSPKFHCGCAAIKQIGVDDLGLYTLDPEGRFANYTLKNGSATYDDSECSAELKCTEGSLPVIFSANYEPMIYPIGAKPNFMCAYTPLKSSASSQKYWFVDGIMLTDPFFACYANNCPCSFAHVTGVNYQYWISSHPLFENVSAVIPKDPFSVYQGPITGDCPDKIECRFLKPLILDTQTAVEFPEGAVDVSCSADTKNWTIDGKQFNQLYATCLYT